MGQGPTSKVRSVTFCCCPRAAGVVSPDREPLIATADTLPASEAAAKPGSESAAATAGTASRLVSLDVFRGATIAGMILVNNPGSWSAIYWPLAHAEWHGWTPTDLIFPFFLFIIGVSMVLSFRVRRKRGDSSAHLLKHVARRSAIIVFLGLFMAAFPFFRLATLRYPGVLQRIGVCYLIAATAYLFLKRRGQVATVLVFLFGYWALMALVPVPGYGVGRLDVEGNLAAFIDRAVMLGHLWKPTWDPEGLLSTLPAIATTLLGALLGGWIASERAPQAKAAGMFAAGGAGLVLGQVWHVWFPINKNLWTSSYVIFTAGFATVLLGLCYWLVDVKGYRGWTKPFVVYGTNAITVFVLSGLLAKMMGIWKVTLADGRVVAVKTYIYQNWFAPFATPKSASLMFALAYVTFWLALMWVLYRRKIFIKI